MRKTIGQQSNKRVLIRKCHVCGQLIESLKEVEKCPCCQKAYLPLNYDLKVKAKTEQEYEELFLESAELHEDDLIHGIYVLW